MEAKPLSKDETVRPPVTRESGTPGLEILLLPAAPTSLVCEPESPYQLPPLPVCDETYPNPNDDD